MRLVAKGKRRSTTARSSRLFAVRFLADESCDAAITRALREAGYDVVSIAETSPGAADRVVLELALVIELASTRANELLTSFVVISPSGVRVTRLPGR